METTCTTVNLPRQRERPPEPLLLNPQGQGGTEDSGNQLGSDKVSSVTMDSRVSTMDYYLNNQGSQMQVIEDIFKQLVGISMACSPPQEVVSLAPPKRGYGA